MKKSANPLIFPGAWFKEKPYLLETEFPADILDLDISGFTFDLPVEVKLEFKMTGTNLLVQGLVKTAYTAECNRCLKEGTIIHQEDNFTYLQEYTSFDQMMNFTDPVREELLVKIPLKFICSEDCKGLCPGCKVNLNDTQCRCHQQSRPNPFQHLNFPDFN